MSSQFVSGGSDLFYLFIFAIWLRRDVERKREKSRCAQLLAAALAARERVPSPAPGPAELDPSPRGRLGDTPGAAAWEMLAIQRPGSGDHGDSRLTPAVGTW